MRVPRVYNGSVFELGLVALLFTASAAPAAIAQESTPDFDGQVAVVLTRHCLECHNPSQAESNLDLSRASTAAQGGDSGPALNAEQPAQSLLWQRIATGEMPPDDRPRLSNEEQSLLQRWLEAGAPWPESRELRLGDVTTDRRAGRDWWSLQPVRAVRVPAVTDPAWARSPLDRFIQAQQEVLRLEPSTQASPATLFRRLSLDLHGLPPTPREMSAFLQSAEPDAYERAADRMLGAPAFGERQARNWLDTARFAETTGFETNLPRPNAWPYRDYVIQAFNADLPYADFIRQQIAGDQLGVPEATGFVVGGPNDMVKSPDPVLTAMQRQEELNDMVSTVGACFLGLTLGCARCHDHKFDPISQKEYYALTSIFAGVQHGESPWKSPEVERAQQRAALLVSERTQIEQARLKLHPVASRTDIAWPAVQPRYNVERFEPTLARYVRFTILATTGSEPCLDELEIYGDAHAGENIALAKNGAVATASGVFQNGSYPIHQLPHLNDGLVGNDHSWISNEPGLGWVQIELPKAQPIWCVAWGRDRTGKFLDRLATHYRVEVALEPERWVTVASSDRRSAAAGSGSDLEIDFANALAADDRAKWLELTARLKSLDAEITQLAVSRTVYAGNFQTPPAVYRLYRGDPKQPKEEVSPAAVAALGGAWDFSAAATDSQRRLAFAHWIADPANPLTARVMVNRQWQQRFGRGLVRHANDFGWQSGQPEHLVLLDYLAAEFQADGGSVKKLSRQMVCSATYRQSAARREEAWQVDADNARFWRFTPRRLEAEAIRDAMLQTSGLLDRTLGGPGFDAFEPNDNYVHVYLPKVAFGPVDWRRMIYQTKARMENDSTFGAFDCPDASGPVGKRNISTTAIQALNLLNSPFVEEQANYFARHVAGQAESVPEQVRLVFAAALSREPSPGERAAAEALVAEAGLPALCRAVWNSSEFVYIP